MGVNMWLLRKFKTIDRTRMKKHLDVLVRDSGKSKSYILFDMAKNFLKRGCSYTDYFRGNYLNITEEEKDTFVTAGSFRKIVHYLNDPKYTYILNDKLVFNKYYKEFLGREYINLQKSSLDEFVDFLRDKKIVFAKKLHGEGGQGIRKIEVAKENAKTLYKTLRDNKQFLVEEAIIQCKELNELNPNVVASFRIITLYKDGKPHLLGNALRINQDKKDVIGCTNDLYFSLNEKGKISSNVVDDYGNIYEEHPLTHKKFSEVVIPNVKEAFDMCLKAAHDLPQVRYIGWDVAFSNKGPILVEGNEYPAYGLVQFYKLNNKKTGHKKELETILKDEIKKINI